VAAIELVLDCKDVDAQATFWAAALDYVPRGAAGQYRRLMPVIADDIEAESARLEALGARRVLDPIEEHGHRWIPMTDPEGNEFCVCAC
jgi:predicted enzyme related to lactoylglutathione lyase